jgi:type VI secretion system protein
MALTLKITSYQSQTLGSASVREFTERGGSIGRAEGNDWVLPDPERYISGRHALVSCQNGSYFLTDTSTNGVFVNGASTPVGNGNTVALHDGDRLSLGDYDIAVSLTETAGSQPVPPAGDYASPFEESGDLLATDPTGRADFSELLDPLGGTQPPPYAPPESGAEADHASSLAESFRAPEVSQEQIPDDWDMTDYSISAPASREPAAPFGAKPVARAPGRSKPAPARGPVTAPIPPKAEQPRMQAPAGHGPAGSELIAAFMRGAGLDPAGLEQLDNVQAMQDLGALFREVVEGMMEVLMARTTLKSEFRMQLTTIRPAENNPLKFSPNVDDALRTLFSGQSTSGYLSPIEAIHEGFEDIKYHQMAMVAGMQAAYSKVLHRFDPDSFEEKDRNSVRAIVPVSRKSRNWEKYCVFYNKLTRDSDRGFESLFGEEFARAYEEQIQRLLALRRK